MFYVFLRAFQQRNVAFDKYKWIMPVSYLMAIADVYIIALIARLQWDLILVLCLGTGSGIGALVAMILHKKYI